MGMGCDAMRGDDDRFDYVRGKCGYMECVPHFYQYYC